jgi:hypothetical protein
VPGDASHELRREPVAGEATRARGRLGVVLAVLLALLAIGRTLTPFSPPTGIDERVDAFVQRVFGESVLGTISPDFQFRGSLRYLDHTDRLIRVEGQPVELFVGVANEPMRQFTMLSKRTAWPSSGWEPVEEGWVELAGLDAPVRRMELERGARTAISYSVELRSKGLLVESLRQALALDRSPWHRDRHMIAVRISARVRRGDRAGAEERIRRLWAKLLPALEGYATLEHARG